MAQRRSVLKTGSFDPSSKCHAPSAHKAPRQSVPGLSALQDAAGRHADRQPLAQLQSAAKATPQPVPNASGRGGLPEDLRTGLSQLSGLSMDQVRVHRNSSRPAQLGAHAFAQGRDIHLAPGQDHHLPHEAWHVVQQAQGRVAPTMTRNGVAINDSPALEREATVMGARALQVAQRETSDAPPARPLPERNGPVQRRMGFEFETGVKIFRNDRRDKEPIPDGTVIFVGTNWQLVSDTNKIEFVSDPLNTLGQLQPVVADIAGFIGTASVGPDTDIRTATNVAGQWQAAAVGAASGPRTYKSGTPKPNDVNVAGDYEGKTALQGWMFFGIPQVSVGVRLE